MPSGKEKKRSNRIVLNVGGVRHETFLSTLKTIPDTRLSYLGEHHTTVARSPEYDASKGEYFFDRHPGVFAQILNFYRTGRLHCPSDVCGPLFEEELGFWGIDEQQVETCCWENYKQHKEKQEKLKYFKLPGYEEDSDDDFQSRDSGLFEDVDEGPSWWSRYQPRVWKSLEEPYTSFWAKLVGIISLVVFTAYIIKFALSTLDHFSDKTAPRYIALLVIHLICVSWFTMDFALRLLFSPEKKAFFKNPYTWTDLVPLVLLYVLFFYPSLEKVRFLEMLVMLKAARIFQIFKLSYVLQVLVNTLKASSSELCLLLIIMAFVMVVFASFVYFLEKDEFASDFKSVPESMWWAVITMTTVGYGEVHPRTWIGKTVGSACAVCGVLVIALPVSVVASNFSLYYTYAKARLNLPPKKRRVAFSHALTSMHAQRTQSAKEDEVYEYKFMSLCSERQTDRSYPASEVSISCTMTPRGSLKKSSFLSLRSMSRMLRPLKRSTASRSKSLNSVFLDHQPQRERSTDRITLKFDPPSRSPSAIDIARDQREGPQTTGENAFLYVPGEDKGESKKETHRTPLLNKSLYPLHLRRGAVSPASFSLKSASTASSLNALPRGYNEICNALSGKGPIILLSDQASVQSLCSLNSRMTCSCSSLRNPGSDGTQGTTANADGIGGTLIHTESDGNFTSSLPQVTLSVPVEYHGKRRHSNGYDGLSAVFRGKSSNDISEKNLETSENLNKSTDVPQEGSEEGENLSKSDPNIESANSLSGMVRNTEDTQSEMTSPISSCNHCWETSAKTINFQNYNETENSAHNALQNDNGLNEVGTKLPVTPVPVVCRAVSAYSIMEYSLGRNALPSNFQGPAGCKDLCDDDQESKTPTRRHSAFTPCNVSTTSKAIQEQRGRLSTGCMKERVAECQPLINDNEVEACTNGEFDKDEELGDALDVNNQQCNQGGKRSRKIGVSAGYSPVNETQTTNPLSEDLTETRPKNHCDEDIIYPCSSNGYVPSAAVQYEQVPQLERTSRV